jgi:CrcB protein
MNGFLLVALGGALGACARYGVGLALAGAGWATFPVATLLVNTIGGFAMGVLMGLPGAQAQGGLLLFLAPGVLGGFTTFSAFAIETIRLIENGAVILAMVNIGVSVAFSLGACAAGLALARSLS